MTLTSNAERQLQFEVEAKSELVKLLDESESWTVFAIVRHQSRSGGTAIVDFLVIHIGQPLYITARIATAVRRRLRGFPVVGGQDRTKTGMVLYKTSPAELVKELSQELFGDSRLSLVVL